MVPFTHLQNQKQSISTPMAWHNKSFVSVAIKAPPLSHLFHQMATQKFVELESLPVSKSLPNDFLAEALKSKLKRLQNPNSRFLQYASPYLILSLPETKNTTLPNGLQVATKSNLASHTTTVAIYIDAASRFETNKTNSVANFLEHMIIKGIEKRPVKVLDEEIENFGGHLNAYTSHKQIAILLSMKEKHHARKIYKSSASGGFDSFDDDDLTFSTPRALPPPSAA
ncbi:Mitochondrial-proCES [Forsythia ovata]|uniref:Mitochondrial-proCES n=1 Tax=Forsythia ovata TaxID=205694 RepID=A0ABD1RL31_9LAMI